LNFLYVSYLTKKRIFFIKSIKFSIREHRCLLHSKGALKTVTIHSSAVPNPYNNTYKYQITILITSFIVVKLKKCAQFCI
jgi:uncharacterized membrane protein